jgi:threonine dehydrogenase-like Zn-dependent dehydrogenase
MRGLWLEEKTLSYRDDLPAPERPGEVLVRVSLAGVCGTDLELVRGYYPYTGVPGHEFVGQVAAGPEPDWIGRRVVGEINAWCGGCEQCLGGRPTHCERRTVLGIVNRDGAHAEYLSLPAANLHPVPDNVTDEAAVFTEPLAAALQIQQQVQVRPGDRVLLVGAGRLGQLIAQTLALTGCGLRVVARHPQQRQLLAARGIRPIDEHQVQPWRWDLVVEATGSPSGFDLARRAVRPGGTFVLKSTYRGEMSLNLSPLVVDEVTLLGSRCGPFAPALRLLESGLVDPTPLVAERFPLEKGRQAYQQAARPGTLKVLLGTAGTG